MYSSLASASDLVKRRGSGKGTTKKAATLNASSKAFEEDLGATDLR
jgi:hypothetical protein|tara:strand:+ start:580 stop:717 length:138 start_codon:yes stop_codon:yes gene_type:complete